VTAHQSDDVFVIADVDRTRRDVAVDEGGHVIGSIAGDIGDRDFIDIGLFGEIVDCAEAHAAGAQNEYAHKGPHGSLSA